MPYRTLLCVALATLTLCGFTRTGRADCQGGPVFGQTIRAADKNTLSWDVPADAHFVKGPLSKVGQYSTWIRRTLVASTSLDITMDSPSPGTGIYYLVKTSTPPCGSWQTTPGAEPGRDAGIFPPCSELNPTEAEIEQAVNTSLGVLDDPFGNEQEFVIFIDSVLAALNATRGKDIWLFGGGSLFRSFLDLGSTRFIARPQFVGKSSGRRSDLTTVR